MSDANQKSIGEALVKAVPAAPSLQTSIEQALSVASRRRFLTTSILGTAGLALSPLERALAIQADCPDLFVRDRRKRGFWATFLNILEVAASIFGFGPLFTSVKSLVEKVRANHKQIAQDALDVALRELSKHGYPINLNNLPQVRLYNPLGITPITRSVANDPRVIMPALKVDKFNGLTTFLNFDAKGAKEAIAGQFAAPSMGGLLSCAVRRSLERYGYRAEDYVNRIIFPKSQEKKSYGDWNSSTDMCEQYTTLDGAVIQVCYKNKVDNGNGGQVEGEVTHFKLEARNSSNKRMGIQRIRFEVNPPEPEVGFGFGLKYVKGDRPVVT